MDALLESPALRSAGAALATALSVSALAHVARKWGSGTWPTVSALFVGADDAEKGDLRFAAVCAALASGLSWVVAFEANLRALPAAGRGLVLAVGLPCIALIVAALADTIAAHESDEPASAPEPEAEPAPALVPITIGEIGTKEVLGTALRAGEVALGAATAVATNPALRSAACAVSGAAFEAGKTAVAFAAEAAKDALRKKRTPAELRALIDHAQAEVRAARARSEDESTKEALTSMDEALMTYGEAVQDPGADLDRIERAVRELVLLARRCHEEEPDDAFRVLGLKRDVSREDAKRVYRELARIYHADAHVEGVDPEKFLELTAAYERVRAYLDGTRGTEAA